MWCCISGEPVPDKTGGRYFLQETANTFQVSMLDAPCYSFTSFVWCCVQANPFTCCCAQYLLRQKVLEGDMSKYICCQGYVQCPCNCCRVCFNPGQCGESQCPRTCLCIESCLCNGFAVSTNRMHTLQKYNLSSDPCDYRLMVFNNWLQLLSCIVDIVSLITNNNDIRNLSILLDWTSDIVYFSISGCMTAQVAVEIDFQESMYDGSKPLIIASEITPVEKDFDQYYRKGGPRKGQGYY